MMSENVDNIKLIGESIFPDKLPLFLELNYLGSKEQEYTTWLYCNLFYLSEYNNKIVKKEFLMTLFELIRSVKDEKVLESCLHIIFNIIHDGDSNLISLFLDNPTLDIVNLFSGILMSEKEKGKQVIIEFLRAFYALVRKIKSKKVEKLKKLKKYLLTLIKTCQNNEILSLTILCLYEFFYYLPEEGNLAKTGMIKILANLSIGFNNPKSTKKIIKILAYSVNHIEAE